MRPSFGAGAGAGVMMIPVALYLFDNQTPSYGSVQFYMSIFQTISRSLHLSYIYIDIMAMCFNLWKFGIFGMRVFNQFA